MATPATIQTTIQATGDGAILFDAAAIGNDRFDPAWFDADDWRTRGPVVALGAGRGAALRVTGPDGDWVLRHYRRGGMVARVLGDRYLWNGAERTRGFSEFRLLAELARRGLNVPQPLAARYRRRGAHYRADLVTRHIDAAQTLAQRVRENELDPTESARVGTGVAEFHAAGAYHADLNAHNILLDAQRVWLLDFDRGALRTPARTWQLANLMRLRRSLLKIGAARDNEPQFDRDCWRPLVAAYEQAIEHPVPRTAIGGAH